MDRFRDWLDPHLIATVEAGMRHSAVALQNGGAARSAMFRSVQQWLARFDVIVSPVLTPPPPRAGCLPDVPVLVNGKPSGTIRGGWCPYTLPYNLSGHPALSIPCGRTAAELPIGLQLVGSCHEDLSLLAVAEMMEAECLDVGAATTVGI